MQLSPGSVDAVVLAGGVNRIVLYAGYRPGHKALIEYHGKASVEYVLDALRRSRYVREIGIVGPMELLGEQIPEGPWVLLPEGDTPVASLASGLSQFGDSDHVLLTSGDLPLLTAEAVGEFLEGCAREPTEYEQNAFIAGVPREAFSGRFAACAKGFMRFRDAELCHGNLALVEPGMFVDPEARSKINALYAARKSPVAAALAVGFRLGVSYVIGVHVLHCLTMRRMAGIASWRFGVGIVPVIVNRPEIAVDVDEPADYQLVSEVLAKRTGPVEGR